MLLEAVQSELARDPIKERIIFGFDHQYAWPRHLRELARIKALSWRDGLLALANGHSGLPTLGGPWDYCRHFNYAVAPMPAFWSPVQVHAEHFGVPSQRPFIPFDSRYRIVEQVLVLSGHDLSSAEVVGEIGSVAGQTLCGLLQLVSLMKSQLSKRIAFWPFDGLDIENEAYTNKHVCVEIYPSIYADRDWPVPEAVLTEEHDRDAWRACRFIQHADRAAIPDRVTPRNLRELMHLSDLPAGIHQDVHREGWILGVLPERNRVLLAGIISKWSQLDVSVQHELEQQVFGKHRPDDPTRRQELDGNR
ncbi:MAG: hypothetical protein C0467_29660 [Planctomycetaceae bacterium]|nr:hypothetical protein [Planctomycetaceae bacterium]